MKNTPSILLCSLLALAGCTSLGPEYQERDVADILKDATHEGELTLDTVDETPQMDAWWQRFNDPALNHLLEMAYAQNRSLEASRATLQAARAAYKYQEGTLWPSIDLGADVMRNRSSDNSLSGRNRYTNYSIAGDATWEIDVFGYNQYAINAAAAQAEASMADLRSAWVSVSAEITRLYLELRTLQARLTVARNNRNVQQATYDLIKDRYDAGLGDALALYQAEYNYQTTRAAIPALTAGIENCENVLAILCGTTPGTLPEAIVKAPELQGIAPKEKGKEEHVILLPTGIPQPEALDLSKGIPADLIRRRPDVVAAERRLKAATELLGNAEMARYPRFYISGSLGLDSLHISDVLDWDSHFYRFGPGITLPLFRGGQICANIEIKSEEQRAALAIYEETVLNALGEVQNALADYANEQKRLDALRLAVIAATNAYEVADDKWQKGLTDFNNVLDAQRSMLSLDESRVVSEGSMAAAQVRLFKSLCGGWQEGDCDDELALYFFGDKSAEIMPLEGEVPAEEEGATVAFPVDATPAVEEAPIADTAAVEADTLEEAPLPPEDLPAEEERSDDVNEDASESLIEAMQ